MLPTLYKENYTIMAFYSAGAVAINLMGNQAARALTKSSLPFSSAIIGGIASGVSCEISYLITEKRFRDDVKKSQKINLCNTLVTLLAGAGASLALSLLKVSRINVIASIGYSILGLLGTEITCILIEAHQDEETHQDGSLNDYATRLQDSINCRVELYKGIFDYLIGR